MNYLPWQKDFLETIKSYENCTINLYGSGGEGKTFLAKANNDPDTEYTHYEDSSCFIPKRTKKRQVVISNAPLSGFVYDYDAKEEYFVA
jgi:hypothetical protein